MRITILAVGSRGDVQPYVALGLGLRAEGHTVRIATHGVFEPLVREYNLDFALVEINPQELLKGADGQAWLESGHNPLRFIRALMQVFGPRMERLLAESWQACADADAIIYSPLSLGGFHIAERRGVPGFLASLQPSRPTRAFPSPFFPKLPLGAAYNLWTHSLGDVIGRLFAQPLWRPVNDFRQAALHLPPLSIGTFQRRIWEETPVLYGYSPSVVPKPADWPAWVHVTGYWFLPPPVDWQPPAGLVDFLDDGPPPVYVGFGSMSGPDPARTTQIVLEALRRTRQRGVLLTGWDGLRQTDLPDSVYAIDSIPHDWLFPRMAAIVHHGGAGTTAAALRAGVPSLAVPFFGDQPYWGDLIAALGVGPRPIPHKRLSAGRLAGAINSATSDPRMRANAAALGARIRAEDGVAEAVAAFHRHVRQHTGADSGRAMALEPA